MIRHPSGAHDPRESAQMALWADRAMALIRNGEAHNTYAAYEILRDRDHVEASRAR